MKKRLAELEALLEALFLHNRLQSGSLLLECGSTAALPPLWDALAEFYPQLAAGVEPELRFDRFYQSSPARVRGGAGLGLSIVRELMEQMGGQAAAKIMGDILEIRLSFPRPWAMTGGAAAAAPPVMPPALFSVTLIENMVVNMIKFAICDDEPLTVQAFAGQLTSYMEEKQITAYSVGSFLNGRALLEAGGGFDVIFLDIQMERPDGVETARLLRQRGDRSLLVFVTVLKERVFDAFDVEACGYLLKPLDSARFHQTMDRVLRALRQRTAGDIVVQRGAGCEVVLLSDIVYCEVLGRKLYLHKHDGTVIDYYDKLEALERRVDGRFFKCHRSYLVNLDYVRGCRAGRVLLPQGASIPVSRLRERELTQALLQSMKAKGI